MTEAPKWFYSSAAWRRLRLQKLARDPVCEPCKAVHRLRAANTVDHRVAVTAGGPLLPDLDGLTSMCASCHGVKTSAEDRADRRAGRGLVIGCDENGTPLDPRHPSLTSGGGSGNKAEGENAYRRPASFSQSFGARRWD